MASGKQVRLEAGLHARLQELARANHRELSAELGLAVGRWLEVRTGETSLARLGLAAWPADQPCLCGRQLGIARCEECPDPGLTIPNAVGVSGRCGKCGAELEWSVADRWWRCRVHGSEWQGAVVVTTGPLVVCDHCGSALDEQERCPVHGADVVMF